MSIGFRAEIADVKIGCLDGLQVGRGAGTGEAE